jgi:hypothetical protein
MIGQAPGRNSQNVSAYICAVQRGTMLLTFENVCRKHDLQVLELGLSRFSVELQDLGLFRFRHVGHQARRSLEIDQRVTE